MEASSKPFYFDAQRTVFFNRQVGAIENSKGKQYPLSTQPFLALCHLCEHPRQVVTWRQLWEASHPATEAYESDSFARARAIIGELRSVLSTAGVDEPHRLIETKRGRGVILNSPLKLSGSGFSYAYLTLEKPMKYFSDRIGPQDSGDSLLGKQVEWLRGSLGKEPPTHLTPSSLDVARLYIKLKMSYGSSPSATALFSILRDSKIKDVSAIHVLRAAEARGIAYSSIGYIYELLALALINAGFQLYMPDARALLDRALGVYCDLFDFSIESLNHVISTQWLKSVTHEVEGNSGLARDSCLEIMKFLERNESDIPLRFSESAILPIREIASIERNDAVLSELALFMMNDPEANSRERFFTVKSALKSAISSADVEKSEKLIHSALGAYSKCWRSVDGNHIIDFAKAILDFYVISGENIKAMEYGKCVLKTAQELGLLRQANVIDSVLREIGDSGSPRSLS